MHSISVVECCTIWVLNAIDSEVDWHQTDLACSPVALEDYKRINQLDDGEATFDCEVSRRVLP